MGNEAGRWFQSGSQGVRIGSDATVDYLYAVDWIERTRTLYLAWQDRHACPDGERASRQWFPVGRLDVGDTQPEYRFRCIRGVERARQRAGFQPLDAFPDLNGDYCAQELFPVFRNRVPSSECRDYGAMLERLGLSKSADPFEILAVSGGKERVNGVRSRKVA